MSLIQASAAIAPVGGDTYGASVAGQVVVTTAAASKYFVMCGANEVGTTFQNGTQSQAITAAGQSFMVTAQGASVYFAGGMAGAIFTGSVQLANVVASVPALTTRSTSSRRVRIFSTPQNPVTFKILGKMAYVPMTYPYHEPMIKASSQAIMAFALAAMLKRARQYAKADLEEKKAQALLGECAKLHTVQEANNQRFVPEAGYGPDYLGPSNQGLWGYIG